MFLAMLIYLVWILLVFGIIGFIFQKSSMGQPRPVRIPVRRMKERK
jgi:hypothetical protein